MTPPGRATASTPTATGGHAPSCRFPAGERSRCTWSTSGLGPSWTDWPDAYVSQELPRALATLPDRLADGAARRQLTAWLLDRGPSPTDQAVGQWSLGGWEDAPSPTAGDGPARPGGRKPLTESTL